MATITQPKRQTENTFICFVKRTASSMRYIDFDGITKPVQPERWETWKVLADTLNDALKTAKYHFYSSNNIYILTP